MSLSALWALIFLNLAVMHIPDGRDGVVGGAPIVCGGYMNAAHAELLRAERPNGTPWAIICADGSGWMAYDYKHTRTKLVRVMHGQALAHAHGATVMRETVLLYSPTYLRMKGDRVIADAS